MPRNSSFCSDTFLLCNAEIKGLSEIILYISFIARG